jgi:hypothetical protein
MSTNTDGRLGETFSSSTRRPATMCVCRYTVCLSSPSALPRKLPDCFCYISFTRYRTPELSGATTAKLTTPESIHLPAPPTPHTTLLPSKQRRVTQSSDFPRKSPINPGTGKPSDPCLRPKT